ncbi:MAG: enoyl-[acyl-carrier-protein] reductase [NADH] [Planctomycetota bacterium]|nr:MAG: enoyl-[acyl-carrier-protein] reductase [NADH] [Planctomycetota bacterium]
MLLEQARGVIMGVANRRSLAWAIARRCAAEGARLAFSVLDERTEAKVRPLVEEELGPGHLVARCDVGRDEELDAFFQAVDAYLEGAPLDFCVHSIAYAQRQDLEGRFLDTSRDGFRIALEVSTYSLVAAAQRAAPRMRQGGALLTLSYLGAERVFPGYNVMGVAKAALEAAVRYLAADLGPQGIAVNAISAGPIQTLSARGIRGFARILEHYAAHAPLRRTIEAEEVAAVAAFLLSRRARAITGEVVHVDAGYHAMGM